MVIETGSLLKRKAHEIRCKSCGWNKTVVPGALIEECAEQCLLLLTGNARKKNRCPKCDGELERNYNVLINF